MNRRDCLTVGALGLATLALGETARAADPKKPVVIMDTTLGEIHIELDGEKAPISTANFLTYVKDKHYDGLVFHRVIPGFMIQGGGMDAKMEEKKTRAPIKNEAKNGLKNVRGTLAMARTGVVDSATSQFFVNVKDNAFLDHAGEGQRFGYAVFGKVIKGMDVVDKIVAVDTKTEGPYENVPVTPVVIKTARLVEAEKPKTN